MSVEHIGKPQDFWNWIERHLDEKGVDSALRPAIRKIIEPAYELAARRPDQSHYSFEYPTDLTEQQADAVTASVRVAFGALDCQWVQITGGMLTLIIEVAVSVATEE